MIVNRYSEQLSHAMRLLATVGFDVQVATAVLEDAAAIGEMMFDDMNSAHEKEKQDAGDIEKGRRVNTVRSQSRCPEGF
jgi:hypothetical protein